MTHSPAFEPILNSIQVVQRGRARTLGLRRDAWLFVDLYHSHLTPQRRISLSERIRSQLTKH